MHAHTEKQNSTAKFLGYRRLWQYAIHAVLQDLGKHWPPQRLSGESLLNWRRQRQLYTDLWRRQLQLQRQKSLPNQVSHSVYPQLAMSRCIQSAVVPNLSLLEAACHTANCFPITCLWRRWSGWTFPVCALRPIEHDVRPLIRDWTGVIWKHC